MKPSSLTLALTGVLLLAACRPSASTVPATKPAVAATESPSFGAAPPATVPASGSAPVAPATGTTLSNSPALTFSYLGAQFTVVRGIIAPSTKPGSATANLTLAAENTSKFQVLLLPASMQLKLGDGSVYPTPFTLILAYQEKQELALSFEVPASAKWTNASLTLSEPDREPLVVALEGPRPADQYPVKLTVAGQATTKATEVTYKVLDGSLVLDVAGQRVAAGSRFLVLNTTVSTTYGPGAAIGADNFRVFVNGKASATNTIDPCCVAIYPGQPQDFQIAFTIPAATTAVELEVGETGKGTARIALAVIAPPAASASSGSGTAPLASPPAAVAAATLPVAATRPPLIATSSPAAASATKAPVSGGVAATPAPKAPVSSKTPGDACALATSAEVSALFGEPVGNTVPNTSGESCNYWSGDNNKLVTLTILSRTGAETDGQFRVSHAQPNVKDINGIGDAAFIALGAQLFVRKGTNLFLLQAVDPFHEWFIVSGEPSVNLIALATAVAGRL